MKKLIVFQVENVLVKGYDEKRMDEVNGKKMVKEFVGEELFNEMFVRGKDEDVNDDGDVGKEVGKRREMSVDGMILKMKDLEKRFEDEGDVEKRFWMRDVREKVEKWVEGKEERMMEMRRKNMESGFERKSILKKEELKDLEKICGVMGGKMVFLSGERKSRVERLLWNNGLRNFYVTSDLESLLEEGKENEMVVFDSVEKLKDLWKLVGLRKGQ